MLGGTFNPPHLGHLALARHALAQLALERVALMPARIPPHKPHAEDPGPVHRLRMCRLCAAHEPGVTVCELELDRDGPSYTVDTLRAIHASRPDAELTFIVGADTAATLPAWREPGEVLRLATLAVAARGGTARRRVGEALASVRPDGGGARFIEMPAVEISSSAVRELLRRGEPVAQLVGAEVAAYIGEHGLYRASAPEAA